MSVVVTIKKKGGIIEQKQLPDAASYRKTMTEGRVILRGKTVLHGKDAAAALAKMPASCGGSPVYGGAGCKTGHRRSLAQKHGYIFADRRDARASCNESNCCEKKCRKYNRRHGLIQQGAIH